MKKIAFVTLNDHVPWGGSEVFWSELAKLCLADKFHVAASLAFWRKEPDHIRQLKEMGCQFYFRYNLADVAPLPFYKKLINRFLPSKYFLKPKGKTEKFDVIYKYKPDLVFVSLGDHNQGAEWFYELKKNNIPYIIIVQLVKEGYCHPDDTLTYKNLRDGYLNAAKVLLTSYDNKRIIEKHLYKELTNYQIINNPIKKVKGTLPYYKGDRFRIANVASLNINHKAQDLLLEALKDPKWRERNIEFNFYGTGAHTTIIPELAKMWNLKNVNFKGFETIENIWSTNNMLIMPSRFEGLSLAFLEALNCSRSAIVTDVGDTARFIDDNVSGFIIKGCEVKLIDEALERAWQKREEWETMGAKAKQKLDSLIAEDPVLAYYKTLKENFLN